MPIYNNSVTLGTAAQLVVPPRTMGQEVHLHNMTKSSNEYIHVGGPGITVNNSVHMDPGESMVITLGPGDDLYALSDPSGLELGILAVIQD
jgi:hypothetical protein